MPSCERTIQVSYRHQVHFTEGVFEPGNTVLCDVLLEDTTRQRHKVLVVIDECLAQAQPFLSGQIQKYFAARPELNLVCSPAVIEGGERTKNSYFHVTEVHSLIDRFHIDRHSY